MSFQYGLYNLQQLAVPSGFCSAPTGLATSLNGDIVTFSWTKPHDVYYYKLLIFDNSDVLLQTRIVYGAQDVVQLDPSTIFKWQVISGCDANPLRESTPAVGTPFTTGAHVATCLPVNVGSVTAVPSINSMDLSWPVISDALGYVVSYRPKSTLFAYETETVSQSATISLLGLASNTLYEFFIEVLCKDGKKPKSELGTFLTALSDDECPVPVIKAAVSDTSAIMSWVALDVYEFNLFLNSQLLVSGYPGNLITLSGLASDTTHTFSVISKCINGTSIPGEISFKTKATSCPKPGAITTSAAGNVLAISWGAVTGATSYKLIVNGTIYTVVGLSQSVNVTPGVSYSISLFTICASGQSTEGSFTTYAHPFTCIALQAGDIVVTPYSVSTLIDWNNRVGVLGYRVRFKPQASGSYGSWVEVATSEIMLTGLIPVTIYDFQIEVKCTDGNVATYTGSFTTVVKPDAAIPTIVSHYNKTDTSVCINYRLDDEDYLTPIDYYQILIKDMVTTNVTVHNNLTLSYCASGLVPGRQYEFRVQVVHFTKQSVPSNAYNIVMCQSCINVTDVEGVIDTGTGALDITWVSSGANSYNVYVSSDDGTQMIVVAENIVGTSYNYVTNDFRYRDIQVESVFTDCDARCQVVAFPNCPIVVNLVSNPGTTIANLSWRAFSGILGYAVEITNTATTEKIVESTLLNTIEINNLNPQTIYQWRVKAICDIGKEGAYSDAKQFLTESADFENPSACPLPTFTAIIQESDLADPELYTAPTVDNSDPAGVNYTTIYGNGFDRTMTFKNSVGDVINTTGYEFELLIYNIDQPVPILLSFTTGDGSAINGGVTGIVQFYKTAVQMSSLLPGTYEFVVAWIDLNNIRKTLVTGRFIVNPEI